MDIFENLENLNVSEECFKDIMNLVEKVISELYDSTVDSMVDKRDQNYAKNPSLINKYKAMRAHIARGNRNIRHGLKDNPDKNNPTYKKAMARRKEAEKSLADFKQYIDDLGGFEKKTL